MNEFCTVLESNRMRVSMGPLPLSLFSFHIHPSFHTLTFQSVPYPSSAYSALVRFAWRMWLADSVVKLWREHGCRHFIARGSLMAFHVHHPFPWPSSRPAHACSAQPQPLVYSGCALPNPCPVLDVKDTPWFAIASIIMIYHQISAMGTKRHTAQPIPQSTEPGYAIHTEDECCIWREAVAYHRNSNLECFMMRHCFLIYLPLLAP